MASKWLTTKDVKDDYHLSRADLKELRDKGLIDSCPKGNRILYPRESLDAYFKARTIPKKVSQDTMVLTPREEQICIKGGNKMRWKNGNGKTPRINLGDFSLIESRKHGGDIVYYIDYYDDNGRYTKSLSKLAKQLGFDRGIIADRKAAEVMGRKVRSALYDQEKSQTVNKKDITFAEFAEIYLKAKSGKKANSLKTTRSAIMGSLVPYFGHVKLLDLNPTRVSEYIQYLRDKPIKDSTISNYLITFGAMVDWAARHNYSVKRKDEIIYMKDYDLETTERTRELEPDEKIAVFKVASDFWKDILTFDLNTGLRLGNVCSLRWAWVDFNLKKLIVPRRSAKGKKKAIEIDINLTAEEILGRMKEVNGDDKYVFMRQVNGNGKQPLSERSLQEGFTSLLKKSGIWKKTFTNDDGEEVYVDKYGEEEPFQNLTFHDLRRTFAMRLHRSGVDLLTLMHCMGHSNINSTMHYVGKGDPEKVKKAFRSLDQESEAK